MEDKMLEEINKQIDKNNSKMTNDSRITTKDTKYSFIFLKYFLPIALVVVLRMNNFIRNTIVFFILLSIFIVIGGIGFYIESMEITKSRKNADK